MERAPKLVKMDEMARLLSMSKSWLRQMVYAGKVPHHRLGRAIRFNPEEVYQAIGLEEPEPGKAIME